MFGKCKRSGQNAMDVRVGGEDKNGKGGMDGRGIKVEVRGEMEVRWGLRWK